MNYLLPLLKSPIRKRKTGFTLTEMAMSMITLIIMGLTVSSVLTTAYESKLTQQHMVTSESIGMTVMEDLRNDTRSAIGISINNLGNSSDIVDFAAGNNITLYYFRNAAGGLNPNQVVTYQADPLNGTLVRTSTIDPLQRGCNRNTNGNCANQPYVKTYVNPNAIQSEGLFTRCVIRGANVGQFMNVPCFSFARQTIYAGVRNGFPINSRSVFMTVEGLRISENPNTFAPTPGSVTQFGQPGFNIQDYTYDLGGAKIFR